MNCIEELDLTNTNIGSRKLGELTANNLTLPHLRTLKVSTPEHINKLLVFNSRKIKQITICEHGHGLDVLNAEEHTLCGSLAEFLSRMSRLVDVDIRNVKLQKTEMKLVAKGLVQEACCISLNLTNCSIGDGGCEDLAKGLVHCKTLRELLLCKNKIGDRGARALAEVFRNSSISVAENKHYWRVIDMSYNHIGDSGLCHLLKV